MAKVVQSLVAHEGRYIVMPPHKLGQEGWANLVRPNIHLAGGNGTMQWPVNTKFVDFDRTFIYGYVEGVVVTKANVGLMNTNFEENVTFGTVAGAVGDTTISVLENTLVDEGDAEANIFAGGYFMARTNPYGCYRIVSNTAHDGGAVGATEMDIVIEEDGLAAIVAAGIGGCKLDRNQYTALYCRWNGANEYETVMGVTLIFPTALTYQWVQTWGPIHMLGDEIAGKLAYKRAVQFTGDGSLVCEIRSATNVKQDAGEIMGFTNRAATGTYCAFVNLRITQ